MAHTIRTVYVVHHSHTDIGYTDLQERVIYTQANYIRTVLGLMKQPENDAFRWNCETLFCVEEFFKTASEAEKRDFRTLAAEGKIGLSANYLNSTDLLDSEVYGERLREWTARFGKGGVRLHTAMCADINGISMGQRDAMLDNGVDFLFTNVHCHHGMYPLYQNQTAFNWEDAAGRRLAVWNGEHYNLGNALGIRPNRAPNFMTENHFGGRAEPEDPVAALHGNLEQYLTLCEENGYGYDFMITAVSGVFSDNAPPEPEILRVIEAYNARYPDAARLRMVSLQELAAAIRPVFDNSPVYRGDFTDWWANGVGSTPYAVKHYREAQRRYRLCRRLDPQADAHYPDLARLAQDNLLLYAEHTWGHSSTISNPCDTMVLNLDMRKNSYASKAHEAASGMLLRIAEKSGDILRYYNTNGTVRVHSVSHTRSPQPVEFYVESPYMAAAQITAENGRVIPCQVSPHPRGKRIRFVDTFAPGTARTYAYRELPAPPQTLNSRRAYVGAERVRDIVNDYDPVTYRLPFEWENKWFRLRYRPQQGVTSFVDKRTGRELLRPDSAPFFTPLYECTPVGSDSSPAYPGECPEQKERRMLGRNIRGHAARLQEGTLQEVSCCERGEVFTLLRLRYTLPGTVRCSVYIQFYEAIPRVDFRLELGKTISSDIESIFLPMSLSFPDSSFWLRKGAEAFRPGVDQLPGTCMEYSMSDDGLAFLSDKGGALIASPDVPLFYTGEMRSHPIRLCDNRPENNRRPVYSWVMNNTWETNFKMDLSGFCEFSYSLWLTEETDPEQALDELRERTFDPFVTIVG